MRRSPSKSSKSRRRQSCAPQIETLERRFTLDGAVELLRDINTFTPGSSPSEIVRVGDVLLMAAGDAMHGRELYVTAGDHPLRLLKDIVPGPAGSDPRNLTVLGNVLLFTADDGVHGRELWRSDGTAEGTRLLADLHPGVTDWGDGLVQPNSSNPEALVVLGENVFFVAETRETGREPYVASESGAALLRDIHAGPDSSDPSDFVYYPEHLSDEADGERQLVPATIFFAATNGSSGRELWSLSEAGNVQLFKNLSPERPLEDPNSSSPRDLTLYNGRLFFSAWGGEYDDEGRLISAGAELWRSDGTRDGTRLFADVNPGTIAVTGGTIPASSAPGEFVSHGGWLYFAATESGGGRELYRTNGDDSTGLFRGIRSGSASSDPRDFVSVGGNLFFVADGGSGRELWVTDGVAANTRIVRDIRAGNLSSDPRELTPLGTNLVFSADDEIGMGRELWITDGTSEGTRIVVNLADGRVDSNPHDLMVVGDLVYFGAYDFINLAALRRSNGTSGHVELIDIETTTTQGSSPGELIRFDERLFFLLGDSTIWSSDGTSGGTRPFAGLAGTQLTAAGDKLFFVREGTQLWGSDRRGNATLLLDVGADAPFGPQELLAVDNRLFFVAWTPAGGSELWISDGTVEGTRPVSEIGPGRVDGHPSQLTNVGGLVYFAAIGAGGLELWKSDGTREGTVSIDVNPDGDAYPSGLIAVDNWLYFVADDGRTGQELWRTGGELGNTELVINIGLDEPDVSSGNPVPLGVLDGRLLFFANDGSHGFELWSTTNDAGRAMLVKDIQPGELSSPCLSERIGPGASVFDGRLYFSANDGIHGCELWVTDAGPLGTFQVADLIPGEVGSDPDQLVSAGDQLFFSARQSDLEGPELFASDGSEGGTRLFADINTLNLAGSHPMELTNLGDTLYFVANDGRLGTEIYTTKLRLEVSDEILEILAKDFAYRDLPEGANVFLDANYSLPHVFHVDQAFRDPATGFDAFGLTADNLDPILVIRGTAELLTDWLTDFDPRGVGVGQFLANFPPIREWLDARNDAGRPPSITGHSLGGALAQLIAAHYTNGGGRLNEVVTFNSPGISYDYGALLREANVERVWHYVTNGDPVSMAGDMFLPGGWSRASFADLDLINNHVLPVLAQRTLVDQPAPEPDLPRFRPDDVTFETFDNTSWLNHPYYFHYDFDYFLYLMAAQLLVSGVPALGDFADLPQQLLFRQSVESHRRTIGGAFHAVHDAIQQILATMTCNSPNARVELGDLEIDINRGLIVLEATDMALTCQANPPALRIQGQVALPGFYGVTANFSDGNYLQLQPTGLAVVGEISAAEIPVAPGYLSLREVGIAVNTEANTLAAHAALQIVPWGITVEAGLGFLDGNWDHVSVGLEGINRPLGIVLPGAFLQKIVGRVSHLAEGDSLPVAFGGEVGMTLGPRVVVDLPNWAGGPLDEKLLAIDVDGDLDANHLTASGTLAVVGGLAAANGSVDLNWAEGTVRAEGRFDVLDGLIESPRASFFADAELNVHMHAAATVNVPELIPVVGGLQGLSGDFSLEFTNDSQYQNDSVAAWSRISLPVIGPTTLGFRVWLDGSFNLIGAEEVAALLAGGEGEQDASSRFTLPGNLPWAMFAANWTGDGATQIRVVTPDGQSLDETAIAMRADMRVVDGLGSAHRRVLVVQNPTLGTWTLEVLGQADVGAITVDAWTPSILPDLSFGAISGGQFRQPVSVGFTASDSDSEARISFFYRPDGPDGPDTGGALFAQATEVDGAGSVVWDVESLSPGEYRVYAQIDDGVNPPRIVMAPNVISISALGVGGIVWNDENVNGVRELSELGLGGVSVFLDGDSDGQWDTDERLASTHADGTFRIWDLAPGTHRLVVVPKPGFVVSNGTRNVSLAEGTSQLSLEIAQRLQPSQIMGTIWRDQDRDGFRGLDEEPMPNVEVRLLRADNPQSLATVLSAADGTYAFTGLIPVSYRIQIVSPREHVLATLHAPGKDTWDNDFDPDSSHTESLSTKPGQTVAGVDGGLINRWQSPGHPLDVNLDGFVTPLDALLIINYLNEVGPGETPSTLEPPPYLDSNADGFVAAIDVLFVINWLNSAPDPEAEGGRAVPRTLAAVDEAIADWDPDPLGAWEWDQWDVMSYRSHPFHWSHFVRANTDTQKPIHTGQANPPFKT